jgi:hypothetical protein
MELASQSTSWHSYGSIYALGHRYVKELLEGYVVVEEKIDGSQFSFGVFGGELKVRSKGVVMDPEAPEKMFSQAVRTARELADAGLLRDGWTYRGEYLQKKHHNTLDYARVPDKHVIIFDIATGEEDYLGPTDKAEEASRIGLEVVPIFYAGLGQGLSMEWIKEILDGESILGAQKREGVVIKAYGRFGLDKKTLMGKYVREEFKEANQATWAKPTQKEIAEQIGDGLRTDARWLKAVQHLRESGALDVSPKDIGPLVKEVASDVEKEEAEAIKDALWKHYKKAILASAVRGLPQWYKDQLLSKQFGKDKES